MKADVFFFITSIAVLALTLGLFIVIFYLIRILNDIKHVSKSVRGKSDVILEDVDRLREGIKSGAWIKTIWGLFHSGNRARKPSSRRMTTIPKRSRNQKKQR